MAGPASTLYFDYAASTPLDPRVREAMLEAMEQHANPAATHAAGRAASAVVERARAAVAGAIGAPPPAIVFTSGATEANNLALAGAARQYARRGRHILTTAIEHPSVSEPLQALERAGFEVQRIPPEPSGQVDAARVIAALRHDSVLVSAALVNNETGAVTDVAQIGAATRERGVLLHCDAAQAAGKVALDVEALGADLLTLSAHKAYGPVGVGALYLRRRPRVRVAPLLLGGGHEQGLRPGTLPVHQVAGMGAAFGLLGRSDDADSARVRTLAQQLRRRLGAAVARNGDDAHCVPHILNISLPGPADAFLDAHQQLAASRGAACSAARGQASPVLQAMGLPRGRLDGALRLSFGRFTTADEVARLASLLEHWLAMEAHAGASGQ